MAIAFVMISVCIGTDSIESDAETSAGYITVDGVAGAKESYSSFEELYEDLKPKMKEALGGSDDIYGQGTVSVDKFKTFFTDNSNGTETDYDAEITYTIHGTVVYEESDGYPYLISIGRAATYFGKDVHLSYFEIKGADADAELMMKSTITLPYQWWKGDTHWTYLTLNNIKVSNGGVNNDIFSIGQSYTAGIGIELNKVHMSGLRCYSYVNESYAYSAKDCTFDGNGIKNAGMHFQGSADSAKGANISIDNCTFDGYGYAINIDQDSAVAVIKNSTFRNIDPDRPIIQIAGCSNATISDNTFHVIGNVLAFHKVLKDSEGLVESILFEGNTVLDATADGSAHFAYTAAEVSDSTYAKVKLEGNRIADSIDLAYGVKDGKTVQMNGSLVVPEDQIVKTKSGTVDIEKGDVKTSSKTTGNVSAITTTISSIGDLDESIGEAIKQISLAESALTGSKSARILIETSDNLTVSESSIEAVKESGASLVLKNSIGSLSLDNDVLGTLDEKNGDVTIVLTDSPSLTYAQSSKIGSGMAVGVSAIVNGESVSSLGGTATISVAFQTRGDAKVTYIADDGSTQNIPCTYSNGIVTFSTNHFSVYRVSSAYTFIPMPDEDDFPGYIPQPAPAQPEKAKDDSAVEVAILVGCIAVVLIGILTMVYRDR